MHVFFHLGCIYLVDMVYNLRLAGAGYVAIACLVCISTFIQFTFEFVFFVLSSLPISLQKDFKLIERQTRQTDRQGVRHATSDH